MSTGAATISNMKTVRRDHSISPTDMSKTRTDEVRKLGAGGNGRLCVVAGGNG
jgi:hypothetical protein